MALVIRADKDGYMEVTPRHGTRFTLEEVQGYVGGYAQIVARGPAGEVMYADADGRVKGLPRNNQASSIAQKEIVGTVLIVANREDVR